MADNAFGMFEDNYSFSNPDVALLKVYPM